MSKDLKPSQRLGQAHNSRRKAIAGWITAAVILGGGGYAAYQYAAVTEVEVATARVRRGDFVISVRTRGELRSTKSRVITAPQVPNLRIVTLAQNGMPVKAGQVVVEFDSAAQEQALLQRTTSLRTADSEIVQTKASHRIINERDDMDLMQAQYNIERAKLEASKAEILSEIEGAKNRIEVGITEGDLNQVKMVVQSHQITQQADLLRLGQRRNKAVRDLNRTKEYLSNMVIRSPIDGIVNVLPNFHSGGSFGRVQPPFKEGDRVWTGAPIAEIPDLSSMRVEMALEEVDRGKIQLGQKVRVRVDAIADREFTAELNWISPIASIIMRGPGMSEKSFPAHATLASVDPRLRPGMSATAEIILEDHPNVLMIPARSSFLHNGKPAVYIQRGDSFEIRSIEVGQRNENDIVVTDGLNEGEVVTLENPIEAAKRAKKL